MWSLPDGLSVLCRACALVLSLQAVGIAIFDCAFGERLPQSAGALRRLGWLSALAASGFVLVHYLLEAGRMAGDLSGVMDASLQLVALRSPSGAAFGMRMLGLTLIVLGLRKGRAALSVTGAMLALAAFTLVGHTSVSPYRPVLVALLLLHLAVVAFWIGALGALFLAAASERPAVAAEVTHRFSAVASWLVPCILIAGILMAVLLIPGMSTFRQPYGVLLLAKAGLFAVLLALAALNKWRLAPRIASGEVAALRGFQRRVLLEYVLICTVLAVTAVMTTFYSPEAA